MILRQILRSWCADVSESRDGPAAIAEWPGAPGRISLRIGAAGLPYAGMDGFEVAEHIQNTLSLSGMTILMLTSDNRSGDSGRCRELGVATYLVKPVRRADLLDSIRSAIARRDGGDVQAPQPGPETIAEPQQAPLRILLAEDCEDSVFLIVPT